MKKITTLCLVFTCIFYSGLAQSGPGGIGDVSGNSILQLWLRGDAGIVVNTNSPQRVKEWQDQSGANNHVSSTGGSKPFYVEPPAVPGVKFNGRQYLQAPASSSFYPTTATIFIVKKKEFTGTAISLSPNGYSQEFLILNERIYHHHSSGNYAAQSSPCLSSMPDNEICIVEGMWGAGATDITYYTNGLLSTEPKDQQGVQVSLSPVNRKITIGQRDVFTPSEYLTGTIFEVIGYNVKLTNEQRIAVENYLACKYGITNDVCGALGSCDGKSMELSTFKTEDELNIYPNPVTTQLYIDFGKSFMGNNVNVSVVNLLGQTVMSKQISLDSYEGSIPLTVDQLAPGNYLLIAEQGQRIVSEKFVIQ
ncbi:MAG: T9SS type A sorting domain-containing protein [Chitinophagales bacterium]|nr:T9SS type A sorting domain-containing protein [Chitinophagales bacterium]